jgi:hypothetical protein
LPHAFGTRFLRIISELPARYARGLDEDDIINLRTGKVTPARGGKGFLTGDGGLGSRPKTKKTGEGEGKEDTWEFGCFGGEDGEERKKREEKELNGKGKERAMTAETETEEISTTDGDVGEEEGYEDTEQDQDDDEQYQDEEEDGDDELDLLSPSKPNPQPNHSRSPSRPPLQSLHSSTRASRRTPSPAAVTSNRPFNLLQTTPPRKSKSQPTPTSPLPFSAITRLPPLRPSEDPRDAEDLKAFLEEEARMNSSGGFVEAEEEEDVGDADEGEWSEEDGEEDGGYGEYEDSEEPVNWEERAHKRKGKERDRSYSYSTSEYPHSGEEDSSVGEVEEVERSISLSVGPDLGPYLNFEGDGGAHSADDKDETEDREDSYDSESSDDLLTYGEADLEDGKTWRSPEKDRARSRARSKSRARSRSMSVKPLLLQEKKAEESQTHPYAGGRSDPVLPSDPLSEDEAENSSPLRNHPRLRSHSRTRVPPPPLSRSPKLGEESASISNSRSIKKPSRPYPTNFPGMGRDIIYRHSSSASSAPTQPNKSKEREMSPEVLPSPPTPPPEEIKTFSSVPKRRVEVLVPRLNSISLTKVKVRGLLFTVKDMSANSLFRNRMVGRMSMRTLSLVGATWYVLSD